MKKVILTAAFLLTTSPAWGALVSGTDALKEWNLIVFGDVNSSSEVEGRTFIGGNLVGNSSNYMVGNAGLSQTDQPGLTVVGNVNGSIKNLNNGSGAIVGGNVNSGFNLNGPAQTVEVGGHINNTNVNQNTVVANLASTDPLFLTNLNQQKALLQTSLTGLSQEFSGLAANSTVTIENNRATFNATPDSDGVAVFNLDGASLNSFAEIQFNVNGADTVIVNVSGENIALAKNFLGGTSGLGEHVIWNFYEAQTFAMSTAWGGSVLAPLATAAISNYIEGSAVFASLQQNGELHLGTYAGNYTTPSGGDPGGDPGGGDDPNPVPEPETWLMLLLGLLLLYGIRRRRKTA